MSTDFELRCAYTRAKIDLLQTSDKEAWFARVETPAGGYTTSLFSGVWDCICVDAHQEQAASYT